ncbi:MAG: hypothetical protein COU90_01450, partial [Candidatus Ryanbacteria bacterium CG10_big_fil_rev_8_21_14_0_10_43_42]
SKYSGSAWGFNANFVFASRLKGGGGWREKYAPCINCIIIIYVEMEIQKIGDHTDFLWFIAL